MYNGLISRSLPNFLSKVLSENGGALVFGGELTINIKEINRARNKRLSNVSSNSPLLNG